jgi:hypothetical protein
MRTFDFAPFYRSTVGFDRMFSMLDQLGGVVRRPAPINPREYQSHWTTTRHCKVLAYCR